jgi:hypothetical protein
MKLLVALVFMALQKFIRWNEKVVMSDEIAHEIENILTTVRLLTERIEDHRITYRYISVHQLVETALLYRKPV